MKFTQIERTAEYAIALNKYKAEHNIFKFAFLSPAQKAEVHTIVLTNTTTIRKRFLGRIGNSGKKMHNLSVDYIILHDKNGAEVGIVTHAFSYCGSQRWSMSGHSALFVYEPITDLNRHQVNCLRCL